jgi:uncharacterized protein (DUF2126 family)
MGGEPTFVSIDDMEGDEWTTAAVGPMKRRLAGELILRAKEEFGAGGFIHYGQGKWYPGESLPRWALTCLWRTDGQPIWKNMELLAAPAGDHSHTIEQAENFGRVRRVHGVHAAVMSQPVGRGFTDSGRRVVVVR